MKYLIFIIWSLGLFVELLAEEKVKTMSILEFVSSYELNEYGPKNGKLNLLVAGEVVELMKEDLAWRSLTRREYKNHEVPANALAACHGWWAGYGQTFYVSLIKDGLAVYYCELDEGEQPPRFVLFKTVNISDLNPHLKKE